MSNMNNAMWKCEEMQCIGVFVECFTHSCTKYLMCMYCYVDESRCSVHDCTGR